jgi:hypothetical protein
LRALNFSDWLAQSCSIIPDKFANKLAQELEKLLTKKLSNFRKEVVYCQSFGLDRNFAPPYILIIEVESDLRNSNGLGIRRSATEIDPFN